MDNLSFAYQLPAWRRNGIFLDFGEKGHKELAYFFKSKLSTTIA